MQSPTGPSYKPPSSLQDDSDNEDATPYHPFATYTNQVLRYTFGGVLRPNTVKGQQLMASWIECWKRSPELFTVTGHFHQNGFSDSPHISLTFKPYLGVECKFHIYCYMRSEIFVHHITMLVDGKPMELAFYDRECC